jgi:hypothetical protein
MIKNIVYFGIIIIIVSFLFLFFASSVLISPNLNSTTSELISNLTSEKNYTINANSFASYTINLNTTTANITAFVKSNTKINLYLMNNNTFLAWKKALSNTSNVSGLNIASKFEGNGVYYIFKDINYTSIPPGLIKNITTVPIYSSNSLLNKGVYYLVMDNTYGSASSHQIVKASILYILPLTNQTLNSPQFDSIKNMINESIWLGSIFFITFIIGIAVLAYGIIKKPQSIVVKSKDSTTKISLADVDELYKGIENKTKNKEKETKKSRNKKLKSKRQKS